MGSASNAGLAYARDGLTAGWDDSVSAPTMVFKTAADAVLATITMQSPPVGAAASGGTATINPPAGETDWLGSGSGYEFTASGTGTVSKCDLVNGDAVIIETLTVGTTASDVIVNTTSWATGNTYRVTNTPTLSVSNG